MTREQCIALIAESYKEFLPDGFVIDEVTADTRLFGGNSPLDSTALVSLIVEVEQQVNDKTGGNVVIADDRAMSQSRSPFRTVGSLADYIQVLLTEQSARK